MKSDLYLHTKHYSIKVGARLVIKKHSFKMCCNKTMKITSKYFAMNFFNLMKQQPREELVRKTEGFEKRADKIQGRVEPKIKLSQQRRQRRKRHGGASLNKEDTVERQVKRM